NAVTGLAGRPASSFVTNGLAVGPLAPSEMTKENNLKVRKKFLAIVGTVALAAGISAVAAPSAHAAGPPPHDASNDTVQCNDIIGKIKFSVPLTLGGTTANQVTLSVKSDDCSSPSAGVYDPNTNPNGISIKSFASKGILNSATNDCLGLQGLST